MHGWPGRQFSAASLHKRGILAEAAHGDSNNGVQLIVSQWQAEGRVRRRMLVLESMTWSC